MLPESDSGAFDDVIEMTINPSRIVTEAKHSDLPSQTVSPTHPLVRHRYAREGKRAERFEQRARRCRFESPQKCAQEDDVSIRQGGSLLPGTASKCKAPELGSTDKTYLPVTLGSGTIRRLLVASLSECLLR